MPLPVTEQEPILHPAALSSYENAEHGDKYDIIISLPYYIGFGLKLMLTHISTALIQTTLVLKFLFEMMMMIIYLFFKLNISILQKQADNFMLELLDKVKKEIFMKQLGGSHVVLLQNKSNCKTYPVKGCIS